MKALLFLFVTMVVFVAFIRYLEATSIFYPQRQITATPYQINLNFEDIYFKTLDNVTLNGWFIKAPLAKSTIIFFHGNAGNIGDRLGKVDLFYQLGLNVFIVDYRGYGKSEGTPTEEGIYLDAVAAYDYLLTREDINKEYILSYGASLGGVAAIDLARKRKLAGLIIDSSFSSAKDIARIIYPFVPSFLLTVKMDSISKIPYIDGPKLFFHSPQDETVPIALGKKLFAAAKDPKEFVAISGTHNEGYMESEEIYQQSLKAFLRKFNFI